MSDDIYGSGSWLDSLASLANTGATAYKTLTGATIAEKPAAPAAVAASATKTNGAPWYSAPWVFPAAAIAGVLVLISLFRRN